MERKESPNVIVKLRVVSIIDEAGEEKVVSSSESFEVTALDISAQGIGIRAEKHLPQKTIVELQIDGAVFDLNESMFIKAEVRSCGPEDSSKCRCGMRFLDINSKCQEAIGGFISKYNRRREPRLGLVY